MFQHFFFRSSDFLSFLPQITCTRPALSTITSWPTYWPTPEWQNSSSNFDYQTASASRVANCFSKHCFPWLSNLRDWKACYSAFARYENDPMRLTDRIDGVSVDNNQITRYCFQRAKIVISLHRRQTIYPKARRFMSLALKTLLQKPSFSVSSSVNLLPHQVLAYA